MVYILDDNWDTERMVIRAGSAAFGLYVRCGMWCARQPSDGVIPLEIAASYGTPEWIRKLLDVGLWESHADGYLDPHFLKRNDSAERKAERREQKAERQRRWLDNQKTKTKRRTTNASRDASHDTTNDASGGDLLLLSSSTKKEKGARPAPRGEARALPDDPPWPPEDPTVLVEEQERLRQSAESRVRELAAARQRRTTGAALARQAARLAGDKAQPNAQA